MWRRQPSKDMEIGPAPLLISTGNYSQLGQTLKTRFVKLGAILQTTLPPPSPSTPTPSFPPLPPTPFLLPSHLLICPVSLCDSSYGVTLSSKWDYWSLRRSLPVRPDYCLWVMYLWGNWASNMSSALSLFSWGSVWRNHVVKKKLSMCPTVNICRRFAWGDRLTECGFFLFVCLFVCFFFFRFFFGFFFGGWGGGWLVA